MQLARHPNTFTKVHRAASVVQVTEACGSQTPTKQAANAGVFISWEDSTNRNQAQTGTSQAFYAALVLKFWDGLEAIVLVKDAAWI